MIQRAIDALPEEQRGKLPALQARLDQERQTKEREDIAAQERARQEALTATQTRREGAIGKINDHLADVLKRATDPEHEGDVSYDGQLLNGAIDDLVSAEVYLQNQDTRRFFSEAVLSRLTELGGPIPEGRYQEMAKWADGEGKAKHGIVGAYLDEMINRARADERQKTQEEAKAELERFKKSELRAFLEDGMRKANIEPDVGVSRNGGGKSDQELVAAHTRGEIGNEAFQEELRNRPELAKWYR